MTHMLVDYVEETRNIFMTHQTGIIRDFLTIEAPQVKCFGVYLSSIRLTYSL